MTDGWRDPARYRRRVRHVSAKAHRRMMAPMPWRNPSETMCGVYLPA